MSNRPCIPPATLRLILGLGREAERRKRADLLGGFAAASVAVWIPRHLLFLGIAPAAMAAAVMASTREVFPAAVLGLAVLAAGVGYLCSSNDRRP